jgi:hypothetical protein
MPAALLIADLAASIVARHCCADGPGFMPDLKLAQHNGVLCEVVPQSARNLQSRATLRLQRRVCVKSCSLEDVRVYSSSNAKVGGQIAFSKISNTATTRFLSEFQCDFQGRPANCAGRNAAKIPLRATAGARSLSNPRSQRDYSIDDFSVQHAGKTRPDP